MCVAHGVMQAGSGALGICGWWSVQRGSQEAGLPFAYVQGGNMNKVWGEEQGRVLG